jgi:hypothetical protein
MSTPEQQNRHHPSFSLANHLVVCLDLLGQSMELERIRQMPETEEEQAAAMLAIRNSAMRAWRMRKTFDDFVRKTSKPTPEGLARIAAEDRATLMRLRTLKVRQRGFSDSFTISVSLQDDGGPEDTARAGFAIWTLLVASAGITLVALATGMPIRRGVAVGTGVDIFPEEIYGAALLDAYRLQSQVADYPRVAVGAHLFEFLKYLEELPPTGVVQPLRSRDGSRHSTARLRRTR